ncbi:MAG: hypothetical protein ACOCV8_01710, partial [Spirochaetota bacterium]
EAYERGNFYRVIFYSKIKPAILEYYKDMKLQYSYVYNENRIIQARKSYDDGVSDGFWFNYINIRYKPYIQKRTLYDKGIPLTTTLYTYYPDGNIKSEQNFQGDASFIDGTEEVSPNSIKDGYTRKYNKNEKLIYEVFYTNGLKDGEERIFENGKIKEIHHYNEGVRELQSTLFDYENNTKINTFYQNGNQIRKNIYVKDELGRTVNIKTYMESSMPYGLWEYYDEDTRLIKTERYREGLKHGEWQYYKYINDNRKVVRLEKYKNDSLIYSKNFYYNEETGNRLQEERYNQAGLPDGEWFYYDDNHNLIKKEEYKDGVPNGIWLEWVVLEDGRIETKNYIIFRNGEVIQNYEYEYDKSND